MLGETQVLLDRLGAADREHQKEAGATFVLRAIKYVCACILAAFLFDVILHLSPAWRLGVSLGIAGGIFILAALGWHRAFIRRNRLEHIARFLEMREPALGSRLINLLQLRAQSDDPSLAPLTRELARQAVEIYAREVRRVPLEGLARTEEMRRQRNWAGVSLLAFAAVLAAFFRISGVEIARFADPFGDHPPYSFTHLEIVYPGAAGTNVLYDKGLVLRVKATGHHPKEVFLTAFAPGHRGQGLTLPMFEKGNGDYNQLLDNIRAETIVFAHTKDHLSESKQVRIGVKLTPQLEKVSVRIAPPAYTGVPPQEKPYAFKEVQALEGSELTFRVQSNRPLRQGAIDLAAGEQPPRRITLNRAAEREVSGSFIATDSGRLLFSVTDTDGLPSDSDLGGALTVTHDLPPEIRIANPEHDCFAAMDFKVQVQMEASDDYGLREIRLHRGLNGVFSAPRVFVYTNIVRDSRESWGLSLPELGVQPGDVITLFAEAIDTAPQPHLTRSQTVRVAVISVEDYNNFLREESDIADAEAKYAELNDDLQELVQRQKELGDAVQKLQKAAASSGAKERDAIAQQLDRLIAQQNELNQKLNRQAERMENFVRQNPLYDVETDLQELLRRQAQAIRQSTKANDDATRDIARRSSPSGRPGPLSPEVLEDFKRASDDQLARLGGVHEETDREVVQRLDDLDLMQELINDFNLFESLYRTQQELSGQSRAYNRPGQLSREDQLALKDLAAQEKQVSDLLSQLQDKLNQDAKAAEKLFPKAARSGRSLAAQMGDRRLKPLAEQATEQMLAAKGDQSFELAERLRGEMEKMFGQCQGEGNCPSGNELDTYLRLQRMSPGNTFAQMARSRKFGMGTGPNRGGGQGQGMMGTSGYAVMEGSTLDVLGNETRVASGSKTSRQSSRFGKGASAVAGNDTGDAAKPETMTGLNPVNRQSGPVSSESVIEQYNEVVESYFKAITTRKEKPANESQK